MGHIWAIHPWRGKLISQQSAFLISNRVNKRNWLCQSPVNFFTWVDSGCKNSYLQGLDICIIEAVNVTTCRTYDKKPDSIMLD